jgi:hypothetical protein
MKSIVNKTHDPLRVPLPHGKHLHLGPLKTGQISAHDADHPPLKKLAEEGKVRIFDDENEAIPAATPHGKPPFEQGRRG